MHVGAKRLFGQPASACFLPIVKKSVFCEKKIKNDAIFGPQKRGPIFEPAPVKFSLKMVRGTKNGAQKWDPKMVPQKNEKMLAEASRNYCGESCCIDMQSQPWIVCLAV